MDENNIEFLVKVINNLLDVSAGCISQRYPDVDKEKIASIILDRVVRERKRVDIKN